MRRILRRTGIWLSSYRSSRWLHKILYPWPIPWGYCVPTSYPCQPLPLPPQYPVPWPSVRVLKGRGWGRKFLPQGYPCQSLILMDLWCLSCGSFHWGANFLSRSTLFVVWHIPLKASLQKIQESNRPPWGEESSKVVFRRLVRHLTPLNTPQLKSCPQSTSTR